MYKKYVKEENGRKNTITFRASFTAAIRSLFNFARFPFFIYNRTVFTSLNRLLGMDPMIRSKPQYLTFTRRIRDTNDCGDSGSIIRDEEGC